MSDTATQEKKKKAPRDRGTGSIYRQPGTMNWTIQFYQNGKRVREKTGTDDKQAAQQKLTARLAQIDKGECIIPIRRKPLLICELYTALENEYVRNERRSLKALKLRRKHLQPVFGNHTAAFVDKTMIEGYCDSRIQEGAKRATVNREVAALKKMFRRAADKLPKVPSFPSKLPEFVRKGFVEDEQFALLVANARELWLRTFLEIAYTLGWRVAEILSRRVRHIDLRQRTIRLEPGETKNGDGRECVLTERIHTLVKECVAGKGKDDFLLTRSRNRPVKDFRKAWTTLTEKAGCSWLLVHDLRRSAARNLRAAGVPESTIMATGGWITSSVFRRYAILSNKDQAAAMVDLETKRAADKAKLEAEQAEVSHSFGHNFTADDKHQPNVPRELLQ
jgi:integrase